MNEKQVTFTMTVEKANVMFSALTTMPYNQVAQLIAELQEQAQKQLQPVAEPVSE